MNVLYVNKQQNQVGAVGKVITDTSSKKIDEKKTQDDTAVVVNFSRQGRIINQNQQSCFDNENVISNTKNNQGEIITKRSLKSILEQVRNGVELSKEDQEQLNQELEDIVNGQYEEMKSKKLSPEDERVLKELKNSYMMKQRSLQDMKKNLEAEKLNIEMEENDAQQTQNMEDAAKKKELIKSLFEEIDENKDVTSEKDANNAKTDEVADSVNVETDKEQSEATDADFFNNKVHIKQLQTNTENLDNIKETKGKAIQDEKYYANLLEEEHKIAIETIKDENMSNLEKVNRYEHFMDISEDLMVSREVAKHVKEFNHRAAVDLKMAIRSNSSVSLAEFMLGKKTKSGVGREFINKM